jgi:1-acyl-sn-glycerol-3-phosphate acyltransferase
MGQQDASAAQSPDIGLRPGQRAWQMLARVVFGSLSEFVVEGAENYPERGPYIIAINHIHFFDVPIVFCTVQHRFAGLAAEDWVEHPVIGWVIRQGADLIPVRRDKLDAGTLGAADRWLRAGGVLLVAPEGTRSPGGLIPGQPGLAYLAARTQAPIVPVVTWGQEHWKVQWRRARRPRINVRIGSPLSLTDLGPRPRGAVLDEGTERVMLALAAMLPERYRGVYADGGGVPQRA